MIDVRFSDFDHIFLTAADVRGLAGPPAAWEEPAKTSGDGLPLPGQWAVGPRG